MILPLIPSAQRRQNFISDGSGGLGDVINRLGGAHDRQGVGVLRQIRDVSCDQTRPTTGQRLDPANSCALGPMALSRPSAYPAAMVAIRDGRCAIHVLP